LLFTKLSVRLTVELSRRNMARDLPCCKERDMRERSALVICSMFENHFTFLFGTYHFFADE
jgi:hypothetical protein